MKKYSILVVDDDKVTLDLLSQFLEEDYDVSASSDAQVALKTLKEQSFDAVLLDINMPHIGGLELCAQIKKMPAYENIPVLFITALSETKKIKEGFDLGAADYIVKPFKLQVISIRLEAHIKFSKKYIDSYNQQLQLNEQIKQLTQELAQLQEQLSDEKRFQKRESNFANTDKMLQQNRKESEKFNKKVQVIQEKLLKQKELLEKTKKMLK